VTRTAYAILSCGLLLAGTPAAPAEELSPEYRKAIEKGLDWVAKAQSRDGHWDANGGQYPTTMTALGGMALLMEGSTIRDGKYAPNIRKAVDWFMERCQRNGLIGNPNNPTEAARYMYGHGFGLLFLSCVYGEEEDGDRRKKLEGILTRAVEFTGKAQSSKGGWYYLSRTDGGDMDEGSVTITQVQALRAARNAGIAVPKGVIDKAIEYLKRCTTARGGVIYSLSNGGPERPALTAAGIACMFSSGEYNSPLPKQWFKYCVNAIPPLGQGGGRLGHDEYTHYYFAQAMYVLGDDGWDKLYPGSKGDDRLSWSKYKKATFAFLVKGQNADGSWTSSNNWGFIGPIYASAVALTILQLEKGTLPIYQK